MEQGPALLTPKSYSIVESKNPVRKDDLHKNYFTVKASFYQTQSLRTVSEVLNSLIGYDTIWLVKTVS